MKISNILLYILSLQLLLPRNNIYTKYKIHRYNNTLWELGQISVWTQPYWLVNYCKLYSYGYAIKELNHWNIPRYSMSHSIVMSSVLRLVWVETTERWSLWLDAKHANSLGHYKDLCMPGEGIHSIQNSTCFELSLVQQEISLMVTGPTVSLPLGIVEEYTDFKITSWKCTLQQQCYTWCTCVI